MKRLGLVLKGRVRDNDADALHVQFGVAETIEKTYPGL